jgi:hypothetical protein
MFYRIPAAYASMPAPTSASQYAGTLFQRVTAATSMGKITFRTHIFSHKLQRSNAISARACSKDDQSCFRKALKIYFVYVDITVQAVCAGAAAVMK